MSEIRNILRDIEESLGKLKEEIKDEFDEAVLTNEEVFKAKYPEIYNLAFGNRK